MKNLAFVIIILAALLSPLRARAQQLISTATPLPGATATHAFTPRPSLTTTDTPTPTPTISTTLTVTPSQSATLTGTLTQSATPTGTLTLSATSTTTGSPTATQTATVSETTTASQTADPAITLEPTQTATLIWLASMTPLTPDTQTPDPALTSNCPASPDGSKPVCSPLAPVNASLFSRANLEPGLNSATASAALIDAAGLVIANAPFNPDGTFTLTAAAGNYILRISAPGHLTAQKTVTLLAGQPIDIVAASLPAGDINTDNSIDALDLISLGAAFETSLPQTSLADLNGDGYVDLFDLTLLARNWRMSGPIAW